MYHHTKYSIAGKNLEKNYKLSNPGPGQYNDQANNVMNKNPSWK
jgi:hypothetical protein